MEEKNRAREQLKTWIRESNAIVFFGGAGVSTESNIPDFRSEDGLYRQQYAYPPEVILSHTFYRHWKGRESCDQSSRKISTACIRRLEAGGFWSCTARFCAITVKNVKKSMDCPI